MSETLPTIIDDMGGLYSHASEVFRAGKRDGRDEFFIAANAALSSLSVEQERQQGDVATRGFHVAEACCKALTRLKTHFDNRRRTL